MGIEPGYSRKEGDPLEFSNLQMPVVLPDHDPRQIYARATETFGELMAADRAFVLKCLPFLDSRLGSPVEQMLDRVKKQEGKSYVVIEGAYEIIDGYIERQELVLPELRMEIGRYLLSPVKHLIRDVEKILEQGFEISGDVLELIDMELLPLGLRDEFLRRRSARDIEFKKVQDDLVLTSDGLNGYCATIPGQKVVHLPDVLRKGAAGIVKLAQNIGDRLRSASDKNG